MTGVGAGTNSFTVYNTFRQMTHKALRVTVIGPWPNKGWRYEVRYHEHQLIANAVCMAG
jgi:hypothetical protein